MFVKPAPGLLLRDPVTKQLLSAAPVEGVKTTVVPAGGMQVGDHDLYWVRRVRDGDAVMVTQEAPAVATGESASEVVTDVLNDEAKGAN
ncbi:DUF2635 domain-containing protein [Paraburkholderia aromaticivorans]|uniref:DUF2635 domain-containing protein n=1 Tax=Paraburkholderia aromaticivorans TaxID=2026199 RepID=UPI001456100A|nr:DUF2635 domain-containing protein [Paraburkholderia aromaticivorans]